MQLQHSCAVRFHYCKRGNKIGRFNLGHIELPPSNKWIKGKTRIHFF